MKPRLTVLEVMVTTVDDEHVELMIRATDGPKESTLAVSMTVEEALQFRADLLSAAAKLGGRETT